MVFISGKMASADRICSKSLSVAAAISRFCAWHSISWSSTFALQLTSACGKAFSIARNCSSVALVTPSVIFLMLGSLLLASINSSRAAPEFDKSRFSTFGLTEREPNRSSFVSSSIGALSGTPFFSSVPTAGASFPHPTSGNVRINTRSSAKETTEILFMLMPLISSYSK